MRTITLSYPSLDRDWSMQFMDDSNYDELFDEDVTVYRQDGSPLLVLLKKALDPQKAANAWQTLKKINTRTSNRSVASGIKAIQNKKMDGTLAGTSEVPIGWEVKSAIVGSFERTIRMPFARKCSWNAQHPEKFANVFPVLAQCSDLFRQHVPDRYSVQKDYCDRTNQDWIIPDTVYTTLTVNKNFRTACHKDAGDLEAGFSNMFVIKDGVWSGGNLVLPNWRLACKLDNLDFIMFDAHEFHGNTQIAKVSKNATRCSVVCYYREKMVHCKSAKEELEFAKNRKLGDPLFPELK